MARSQQKNRKIKKGTLESEVYEALAKSNSGFALALELEDRAERNLPTTLRPTKRKIRKPPSVSVPVSLTPRLLAALESLVIETGTSRRSIIETALSEYLRSRVPWFGWDQSGKETLVVYEVPDIPDSVLETIGED